MNILQASEKLRLDLKRIFNIDVEILPVILPETEIGFTLFPTNDRSNEKKVIRFHFNPKESL